MLVRNNFSGLIHVQMQSNERISIIDAFRGFALAGIVLTHMVEHYIAAMAPPDLAASFAPGPIDQIIQGLMFILITGKFFALFSFLFGLSFFIQMDRAARKEVDFRVRFVWRLVILLLIGYLHSLFYRGDILTIYAILGFFLVFFYNVRSSLLLAMAAILLLGAGRYAVFALYGGATIIPGGDLAPDSSQYVVYFDALMNGSLRDVFASNAINGHLTKMEFQVNFFGRWYLTFAFFLLGLWAGRIRLFQRLGELQGSFKKALWVSVACMIGFMIATAFLFSQGSGENEGPQFDRWSDMFALTALDLFNFSLTIALLCTFVLIFSRPTGGKVLGKLAPYGRMALTNYFMQTVFGTFILYHWGLGLMTELPNSQTLLIALGIITAQVIFSSWWLSRFRYGPLEWLWRSGTYLAWQQLRR